MIKMDITDATSLGRAIRSRRKTLRLRIDDAALLCGIAVSTLSALENGSRPVGFDKVCAVLSGLGVSLLAMVPDQE